jgi:hypothetical protein
VSAAINPTNTEVADILDQAIGVIRTNGWHQGDRYDHDQADAGTPRSECRVCAVGAIAIVISGSPSDTTREAAWAAGKVRRALGAHLKTRHIVGWNDTPGRTAEQVIQAFRETAAGLRAGEAP